MDEKTRRVLIVEDDEATADTIKESLEYLGYEVSGSVTNGEDAIERIKADEPDIVLMDIEIQGELDGIQTAKELITISNVPVIYLTGISDDATLERAIKTAPYGYITKPFEPDDLKIAIEIALNKHELDVGRENLLSRLQGVVSKIVSKYIGPEKLGTNSKNWFK